ncbi:methionyl-tRNA formyltransferase [Domibacillus sp. DTU_2020_1001157_1_SI_ALB_TIR_016]|uniref:methionyl-tRNA formyltransferase n=1 Tax=Domibacillus sp. DTU_2020_1001157_1_SI_ALB_TIR_016 TaxID=3077789 RepID=UPI0028EF5980|nr:methionyl-tRNA formyltransferase [Domibacillus sp. DTU_2020_1001157_1_SI_ALB_TIR_016]WNS79771.1 methionyl-tRNA formyltransferase [Domibacillus sp. DTU_2020_1001157_1_SI_ALB_TIR_016]
MTTIVFMGTPDFSVPVLEQIIKDGYEILAVVTQPDRPVGRKKVLTPPPVKAAALEHGLPVLQPEKLSKSAELDEIIALKPDLVVTAAYGQLLPNALLEAPKYGCINVHASLLPELRGGAPIHYSILQGKKETGITIMYMAEKLDAGDIISQAAVTIEEDDNTGTLHDKLSAVGADLLSKTIPALIEGTSSRTPQDGAKATFAPNIRRQDEKIDWSRPGEELYNQVRGLCPWPVAYTTLNEAVVKVWKSEKTAGQSGAPGTVIALEEDGIVIATGSETALKITELQPAGKKRMSARDYLRGSGSFLQAGAVFGD